MALFTISAAALIDTAQRHGGAGLDVEADAPDAATQDTLAVEGSDETNATLLMLLMGLNHVAPLCMAGDAVHIALHAGEALLTTPRPDDSDDSNARLRVLMAIDRQLAQIERSGADLAWLAPDSNHAGLARAGTRAAQAYDEALAEAAVAA